MAGNFNYFRIETAADAGFWPEYKALADRAAGNLAEHGLATPEAWQLKHWSRRTWTGIE